MNVLFTHSYFYRFDPKQWKAAHPYPPLGTIQAAAFLRENGHDVSLFDAGLASGPEDIQAHLSQNPDVLVIYDDGFNYLTKMCLTRMRQAAFDMAIMARQQNLPVVMCSSDATDHYEKYLSHGCDFVIPNEGEQTLSELIERMSGDLSSNWADIKGLIYKKDGTIHKTTPRPVMRDLDSLPLPGWDLIEMDHYRDIWLKHHGYFSLNIATTRGCPYKCNWCAKPMYGNRYNARSPEHVANEISLLINRYNVQYFWFCDDIFGLKPQWVQQFNQVVQKRNLNFKYKIQSRVDLLLKEDTIESLAVSGVDEVWVGAESGSQKILDAMDKGTRVEQINLATQKLKAHNIKMCYFLQFGYPGEDMEDIRKTIKMLLHNMPHDIGVSISYPLPGTKFYENVKHELQSKQNWSDSDDLDLMHTGTYSSSFYRILHKYVHRRFRLKSILNHWSTLMADTIRHPSQYGLTILKQSLKAGYYAGSSLRDAILLKVHSMRSSTGGPDPDSHSPEEAFSRQAATFDAIDSQNPIIQKMRHDIYRIVDPYLKKNIKILELNAGTGIDANYFARKGCKVTATDYAAGMIEELKKKAKTNERITVKRIDFNHLETIEGQYDLIFSNFGGLNCSQNLERIFDHFKRLLKPGGKICLVMIGKFCLWEFLMALKGNLKLAFRRFQNKTTANLEGVTFNTYYFSPSTVKKAMNPSFREVDLHGIGVFIPPPYLHHHFLNHPKRLRFLHYLDKKLAGSWPFNKMGDHFLALYEYKSV